MQIIKRLHVREVIKIHTKWESCLSELQNCTAVPLAGCSQMFVTVQENASHCLAGRVEYDRVMQEYMRHVTVSLFSKAVRGDLLESCLVLYSLASDPEELARSLNVHTSSRPPCPQNSLSLRRKCLVFAEMQPASQLYSNISSVAAGDLLWRD